MSGSRTRRVTSWLTALVLVVATVAALGTAWSRGSLNSWICGGDCGASAVLPPQGLGATGRIADDAPRPERAGPLDAAAVRAAVAGPLTSPDLGGRVGFAALGAGSDGGGEVVTAGDTDGFVPASTTKIVTTFTALTALGPQHRFSTRAVLDGDRVVLVGGGDPYLVVSRTPGMAAVKRAQLSRLADATARALTAAGRTSVQVGYDTSRFSGPEISPTWEPTYVPEDVVDPISPLWAAGDVHSGAHGALPADRTTVLFAQALQRRGITVEGDTVQVEASPGATELAVVRGATVAQIARWLLLTSDNEAAEVLLRQAAIAEGRPGSFEGGAETAVAAVRAAGIDDDLVLNDGSGLSRDNRIAPATLARLVAAAGRSDRTASIYADLPVGGFSGSLARRFTDPASVRGATRAKTGTLTGVHSIAGVVTDATGAPVFFAVMVDDSRDRNGFLTQVAIDDVASAVAACRCTTG